MKSVWSIVITGDQEHCDYMGSEYCDDSGSWSTVMTSAMEHCDDRVHGVL